MIIADETGRLSGNITIPDGIPAGDKKMLFIGVGGSLGEAIYSGQGTLTRRTYQVETTVTETRWQSPPPSSTTSPAVTVDNTAVSGNVPPKCKSQFEVMYEHYEPWVRAQIRYPAKQDVCESHLAAVRALLAESKWAAANAMMNDGIRAVYIDGIAAGVWPQSVGNQIDQLISEYNQRWSYTQSGVDPLAQTFTLSAARQIAGVDLWFTACGGDVRVDLRGVTAGVPDQRVLASTTVKQAAVSTSAATRILFPAPVMLAGGAEYALVILANDATTEVAVAELGKWDETSAHWVTQQPYTVGVLLSSSNASTWTAHQDRDLTFRLLAASYTATSRDIALGTVAVDGVTDLMLMSYAERPDSATRCEYRLTLPDGTGLSVEDGQAVRLPAAITGDVGVAARLLGTADASPVLHPVTQLAYGQVEAVATYVSRAIPAGQNARVRVIVDAAIPSGSGVAVSVCGIDAGDAWQAVPYVSSRPMDDGLAEITYELAALDESSLRIKLELTGHPSARPRLRNLRVIVL